MKLFYQPVEGFDHLENLSEIEGYSKRAFVLAGREDLLVIDRYKNDLDLPLPEHRVLNPLGIGPSPENVFIIEYDPSRSYSKNVQANMEEVHRLKTRLQGTTRTPQGSIQPSPDSMEEILLADPPGILFVPFAGNGERMNWLTHCLNDNPNDNLVHPISAPETIVDWVSSKKTLLELGCVRGLTPRGFFCERDDEILEKFEALQEFEDYPGTAVIKPVYGASGLGSTIVSKKVHIEHFLQQYSFDGIGAVITEWISAENRSPSINYFISERGVVSELFVSDQIFEDLSPQMGEEGTRVYRGNEYPSRYPPHILQYIRDITRRFVDIFRKRHYWGMLGFDAIVASISGEEIKRVLVTDVNPRITSPAYGYWPMKRFGAGAFRIQNESYRQGTSIFTIIEKMGDVLLDPKSRCGWFPFNIFPGKCTGVTLAENLGELEQINTTVDEVLIEFQEPA